MNDDEFVIDATLFSVGASQPLPPPVELLPEPRLPKEPDRTQLMPFAGGAEISPCDLYRYSLYRRWQEDGKKILFIGNNPSKADASINDNTVVRLTSFSKRDDYGEFWLGNANPYRSTNPKGLKNLPADYNEEQNREHIRHMADGVDKIVVCWGNNIELIPNWQDFVTWLCTNYEVWCFGRTKRGHPKHPLRLPADTLYSRYYAPVTAEVVEKQDDAEFVCENETASHQEISDEEF